jgi:hypothetical protein
MEDLKIGDMVYTNIRFSNKILFNKINGETKTQWILNNNERINKSNGLLIGSSGPERFDVFNRVYYFKASQEFINKEISRKKNKKLLNKLQDYFKCLEINDDNFEFFNNLNDTLPNFTQKKES